MKIKAMQKLRWPLSMMAAGALMIGCSGTTEEPTMPVEQALDVASNSSDAPEAANLMRGPLGLRSEAVEGFRCDSSPDLTYVEVCGQNLPATVHLEWTACAMGRHGGGMGMGDGGCGGGMQGGGGDGGMYGAGGGSGGGGGMMAGSGPRARMGGLGFGAGTSSGTVDLTNTYATPDGCGGAIVQTQSATFNVTRTRGDGGSMNATGTSTSTAQLDGAGPPASKTTQLDVIRTRYDADGTVINSVHVTGSTTVAFSSDVPPVRTINGTFTEDSSVDGIVNVTLTDVVRPPHSVCRWPTSGTLTRVLADGTTHTLVYGPSCGEATLDGAAVTLPDRGGRGGRRP